MLFFYNNLPIYIISCLLAISSSLFFIKKQRNRKIVFNYAMSVLLIVLLFSVFFIDKFSSISSFGFSSFLGGWQKYGIEVFYSKLSLLIIIVVLINAFSAINISFDASGDGRFGTILLISTIASTGMIISKDIFNIYIFLELCSICAYIIMSFGINKKSLKYSFDYLIIGSIGSILFLIGVAILYLKSGHLNMSLISTEISDNGSNLIKIAYIMIVLSFVLKSGLFPFQSFIVTGYNNLRSFSFNHTMPVHSKVMLLMIIKISYTIFQTQIKRGEFINFFFTINIIAITGILYLSIKILITRNVSNFFILSYLLNSIYVLLCLTSIGNKGIINALYIFILSEMLIKSVGCMILHQVKVYVGHEKITYYDFVKFLNSSNYYKFVAIFYFLLIGSYPMTIGFVYKFEILRLMIQSHQLFYFIILLYSSILSFYISFTLFERFVFFYKKNQLRRVC